MFTEGVLGKIISDKVVIISGNRITVDGKEISKEESDRLKEDSGRKLLHAFMVRRSYRIREKEDAKVKNSAS
jgi:hypothetical protein